MIKRIVLLGVCSSVLGIHFGQASASSFTIEDDAVHGNGSLVVDVATNLAWLSLSKTACIGSWTAVNGLLAAGGQFSGFRYATEEEVIQLFANAGIPDLPQAGTLQVKQTSGNYNPIGVLLGLIGTSSASSGGLALGVTGTPSSYFGGNHQVTSYVYRTSTQGVAGLSATGIDDSNCASGHWLVKSWAPPVTKVSIDIKPGSYPNCFNVNGHGVIPVAILGSNQFDVTTVDPMSLQFGAFMVRVRGNKGPLCSVQDVNGDSMNDLVCQFEDNGQSAWETGGEATATLTGTTYDGRKFEGSDSICIVP